MLNVTTISLNCCLLWGWYDETYDLFYDVAWYCLNKSFNGAYKINSASIWFARKPDYICCSIIDNGPGIKAPDLPKLFKRFSQLQDADAKLPGSGLGLAFVDVVSRRHGGYAQAESVPGNGARFSIVLPLSSLS